RGLLRCGDDAGLTLRSGRRCWRQDELLGFVTPRSASAHDGPPCCSATTSTAAANIIRTTLRRELGYGLRRLILEQCEDGHRGTVNDRLERVACDGTRSPLYAPCLAGIAHALTDHAVPLAGLTARHAVLALVAAWWSVRLCLLRQRPDGLTWARQLVQQVVEICRHLTRYRPRWNREFGWR